MSKLCESWMGLPVLLRTTNAGVHFGVLVDRDPLHKEALLKDCRRLWSWKGANTLHEVSSLGISEGKISQPIKHALIVEVIEILPLTTKAQESLKSQW